MFFTSTTAYVTATACFVAQTLRTAVFKLGVH